MVGIAQETGIIAQYDASMDGDPGVVVEAVSTGRGSAEIEKLTAVDGLVDSSQMNQFVAKEGTVSMKKLEGFNAYTTVEAREIQVGVSAGDASGTGGGNITPTEESASNQTWIAHNMEILNPAGLTLTDSTLNITNAISGNNASLTLNATQGIYTSYVKEIDLNELTISTKDVQQGEMAVVTMDVSGLLNIQQDVMLEGKHVVLEATSADIAGTLTVSEGATYVGSFASLGDLEVSKEASATFGELVGISGLEVRENSIVSVTGTAGLTGLEDDVKAVDGSQLKLGSDLETAGNVTATDSQEVGIAGESSIIEAPSVTAGGTITAQGSSIVATKGDVVSGTMADEDAGIEAKDGSITVTDGSLQAEQGSIAVQNGSLTVSEGSTVAAAKGITVHGNGQDGVGDVTVTGGSTVGGAIEMDGGVANVQGSAESLSEVNVSITGASKVDLSYAKVGSVIFDTPDNEGITMSRSTVSGNVGGATSLVIKDHSLVDGDISFVGNGNLSIRESKIDGSISGHGSLNVVDSEVEGTITDAGTDETLHSVTISGKYVSKWIHVSGDVTLDMADVGNDEDGTPEACVDARSLTAVGGKLAGDVILHGGDVSLTGTDVGGDVTLEKEAGATEAISAVISGGSAGNITGADSVSLTDTTVGEVGSQQASSTVSVAGEVKAAAINASDLSVSKYASLRVEGGNVEADGLVTIAGDLLVTTGDVSLNGSEPDSVIAANVTAENDVILSGAFDVTQGTVGGQNVVIGGVVNVWNGAALSGAVVAAGNRQASELNYRNGGTYELAGDTNMKGGSVNVLEGSTLNALGGHLGNLSVQDTSALIVGG